MLFISSASAPPFPPYFCLLHRFALLKPPLIRYYNICVQMKVVSGQALALNSLGINKFLSGDLQVANEMFQVKAQKDITLPPSATSPRALLLLPPPLITPFLLAAASRDC